MTVDDLHRPVGDESTDHGRPGPSRAWLALISLTLALSTVALFWSATRNGFVNFDDPDYVSANPRVQQGVTFDSLQWAFTSYHSSNWHPLTWISHMVDWQLFGKDPRGHHATSVLIHATNAALLLLFLTAVTRHPWPSAFVAALFAWHPLHVESVAWVSERKDVLCAFFFILTLWTFAAYTRTRAGNASNRRRLLYIGSLFFFALGLMSKPMLVTLPCVLLLLDFWPLRRLAFIPPSTSDPGEAPSFSSITLGSALFEKIPFFALSLASSIATFAVQRASGSTVSLAQVPFESRLGNAILAYARYLGKTFWPTELAVFYPFTPITTVAVTGAVLLLVAITAAAVINWRRLPYLLTGWLWFLGMLVPVIGIVQVGKQAYADRYTYLPHIGLFIALTWSALHVLNKWRFTRALSGPAAVIVLLSCAALTLLQIPVWYDSKSLFEHANRVTSGNYVARAVLATVLVSEARLEEAIDYCRQSLEIAPGYSEALNTLGGIYLRQGRVEDAINSFREALKTDPNFTESHVGLGTALIKLGKYAEAEQHLREALRLSPMNVSAKFNLAMALHNQNQLEPAASLYRDVIAADPSLFSPRRYLGNVLISQGKPVEAISQLGKAVEIRPNDPETRLVLGMVLLEQGRVDDAAAHLTKSVALAPTNALAFYQLALVQQGTGKPGDAVRSYRQAIDLRPDWPEPLNNLAWIYAASADSSQHNGSEAVRLAGKACALTTNNVPVFLGTLAAAYARAGSFPDAVAAAEKARDLAIETGQKDIARRNEELLQLYRAGKAFHE